MRKLLSKSHIPRSSDIPAEVAPQAARLGRVRVGLLIAALIAASVAGACAWRADRLTEREAAAQEALEAVRERLPALLSYRYATLDEDLDAALAQTTGEFTDEYSRLLDEVVRETATQRRIITETNVNAAGVVSVDSDSEAVVLVFLTQSTTGRGIQQPVVSGSRVEVTMSRVDDDWLIADLRTR